MIKYFIGAAALAVLATPSVAAIKVTVEAPGAVYTTQSFVRSGIETFDGLSAGNNPGFVSQFGGTDFTGTYSALSISAADIYGGAGGTGFYADADSTGNGIGSYTLTITPSANYFGFWLSALHPGNEFSVTFSGAGGTQTFDYNYFMGVLNATGNADAYRGNPFLGGGENEHYAFFNFYMAPDSYNTLKFNQNGGGGFETDNHTVGVVPEPATWAMMITGFGLVGFAARHRRKMVLA